MNVIIGAGAVGTVLAYYLQKTGQPVTFLVRPQRIEDYKKPSTLEIEDLRAGTSLQVAAPAVADSLDAVEPAPRRLIITVKHEQLDQVLTQLGELPPDLILTPCLNGISHLKILEKRYPNNPLAPITVMFNAARTELLHARLTTAPQVLIAEDALRSQLKQAGMAAKGWSPALAWGKLLINLNNAIGALAHTTFKDMLLNAEVRDCYLAALDEALAALEAAGIEYETPLPLPLGLQTWVMKHIPRLAWRIAKARNGLTDQSYPSMVADIEAGHRTEVDQLNGEIVRLGAGCGVETPVNRRIVDLIHARERGELDRLGPQELRTRLGI